MLAVGWSAVKLVAIYDIHDLMQPIGTVDYYSYLKIIPIH